MWTQLVYSNWPPPGYYWYRFGQGEPDIARVFPDHIYFATTSTAVRKQEVASYAGKYWIHLPKLTPPLFMRPVD